MRVSFREVLGFTLVSLLALSLQAQPKPLTNAHAHNDYVHTHPLFDALDHGFCSVEADIHLIGGQLLVAHTQSQVIPGKSLQTLYLDPLRQRVAKNGGRVYRNGPEITLLIDIKSSWQTTYPVLREVLKQYADILSSFESGKKNTNAVVAIITGDRSRDMFDGESIRYAAFDGDLTDLDSEASSALIPWISSNWSATFKWRAKGPIPQEEQVGLKQIVARAHRHGRRVRFWGAPDNSVFWHEMLANGVDLINTDDLEGAQKFLTTSGL